MNRSRRHPARRQYERTLPRLPRRIPIETESVEHFFFRHRCDRLAFPGSICSNKRSSHLSPALTYLCALETDNYRRGVEGQSTRGHGLQVQSKIMCPHFSFFHLLSIDAPIHRHISIWLSTLILCLHVCPPRSPIVTAYQLCFGRHEWLVEARAHRFSVTFLSCEGCLPSYMRGSSAPYPAVIIGVISVFSQLWFETPLSIKVLTRNTTVWLTSELLGFHVRSPVAVHPTGLFYAPKQ